MQIEQEMSPSAASPSSAGAANAPGVVATVVVTQPAPQLPDALAALAAQDYPNLQVVVLVTGSDEAALTTTAEAVALTIPTAHVRQLGGNPGFGPAANAVLRLVEGDSGFFLLMHDDVALDPGAVTVMVEEVYRSNAGVVGPKLVDWDDPRVLQVVGYDADRFGVLDTDIEPGEIDQEQHDAVRDVFVVPSACLLVRADLFRTLEGFEPTIDFHGDDVDLCWRAHASGARVVVVPAARARHAARLADRRPDLNHERKAESHRTTTVAVMTGGLRLPFTLATMLVETLIESLLLATRGRFAPASSRIASLGSMLANIPRIVGRRRRLARHRHVPDHEVFELQRRGSVRWSQWVRGRRGSRSSAGNGLVAGPARATADTRVAVGYLVLALLFVFGARDVITGGVARLGDFVPLGAPRALLGEFTSGWWSQGLGASAPHPTAHLLVALAGFVTLGHPGLLLTLMTVGLIPCGWWGASRVCRSDGDRRTSFVGAAVYAAVPLPYAAFSTGNLSALVGYAALPWVIHLLRSFFGENASGAARLRAVAVLTLLLAVVVAFAPVTALVIFASLTVTSLVTAIGPGNPRVALASVGVLLISLAGAVVLNIPWVVRFLDHDGWSALVGVGRDRPAAMSLSAIARFGVAPVALGGLILATYVPALVAPLVAREWRLVRSLQAATLVAGGVLVTVIAVGGHSPFALPEPGVLLVPVAVGLALGSSNMVRVFADDVRGGSFGWRQPLAIVALVALPIGLLPAVAVSADGAYRQPTVTFLDQMDELLHDRTAGDFRVLVIGDTALVPGAARDYSPGVAYSVVNNGVVGFGDVHSAPDDNDRRLVDPVVDALSARTTERVGRLSAPLGIKYFVVPLKGVVPDGLVESLETQLDLRRIYSPASMMVFENTQFIPVTAMLSTIAAGRSTSGGEAAIAQSDLTGSIGVLAGVTRAESVTQLLPAGTLHVGVPLDPRWRVELDGETLPSRASFGSVMAFEVPREGTVTLSYRANPWRYLILVLQVAVWLAVLFAAVQPRRRRRGTKVELIIDAKPVVVLDDPVDATVNDGSDN